MSDSEALCECCRCEVDLGERCCQACMQTWFSCYDCGCEVACGNTCCQCCGPSGDCGCEDPCGCSNELLFAWK